MAPITKLLVANRGEIAARIQRSAHDMGLTTVAVFSDADAGAPFVRSADEAVRIGPAPSRESYLRIEAIVEAAQRTGANAIHPGFGFLAENSAFARAVEAAGLIWVGPGADAIAAMGSKREAKAIARKANVPVIPGTEPTDQSTANLAKEARAVGFPVLLKASAGGGGKGMRVLAKDEGLEAAIESAKRESASSFGDDTLLIEKYIERPRHVEIQILGDAHGNLVHLFERECSIQRRHQKIVEETPSPALNAELRAAMGEAAVRAGRAVGYRSAGTVEFILAPDGNFYFLEVNTRLQVEHPITECVTGVDIVQEQLRIAEGEPLAFTQDDLTMNGAAVECRLYAEDAGAGFLPTTGKIVDFHVPDLPGLRVDSGIERGFEVGIHYDPMLAKVITHAPNRREAIRKMVGALRRLSVEGVVTNRAFLLRVLEHPEFLNGNTHTHFIDEHLSTPDADPARAERERLAAVAATLFARSQRQRAQKVLPGLEPGFRNNRFASEWVEYRVSDQTLHVSYASAGNNRLTFHVGEHELNVSDIDARGPELSFEDENGIRRRFRINPAGQRWHVHSVAGSVTLTELPRFAAKESAVAAGACIAPMPGKVVSVSAAVGDRVEAGTTLVVLEAMKMEHAVKASQAGTVSEVLVSAGEQVDADAVLIVVDAEDPS